jgi:hypothetical protein
MANTPVERRMEGTPAPGDVADLQQIWHVDFLIRTNARRSKLHVEHRRKRKQRRQEKLKSSLEAREKIVNKQEADDAKSIAALHAKRREIDLELQRMSELMAHRTKEKEKVEDLKKTIDQEVQALEEDFASFKARCDESHEVFKTNIFEHLSRRSLRGNTPEMISSPESLSESEAEPEDQPVDGLAGQHPSAVSGDEPASDRSQPEVGTDHDSDPEDEAPTHRHRSINKTMAVPPLSAQSSRNLPYDGSNTSTGVSPLSSLPAPQRRVRFC